MSFWHIRDESPELYVGVRINFLDDGPGERDLKGVFFTVNVRFYLRTSSRLSFAALSFTSGFSTR